MEEKMLKGISKKTLSLLEVIDQEATCKEDSLNKYIYIYAYTIYTHKCIYIYVCISVINTIKQNKKNRI